MYKGRTIRNVMGGGGGGVSGIFEPPEFFFVIKIIVFFHSIFRCANIFFLIRPPPPPHKSESLTVRKNIRRGPENLIFFYFQKKNSLINLTDYRRTEKLNCGEAARGEKRGRRLQSRVVICVSRAFCSTDQENRETAPASYPGPFALSE